MKLGHVHQYKLNIQYCHLDMYSVVYHPRYLEIADSARNQAFSDFGYPVEEQLKDKVGFTVGSIDEVRYKRPLFMSEEITVSTEVLDVSKKSCRVRHWINVGSGASNLESAIFSADYTLVFVSIEDINEFPLNTENIKRMKAVEFNQKVKKHLSF
ncbi:MAG: acyl-CoA thioesterase [Bacteriovoracia bacterium]